MYRSLIIDAFLYTASAASLRDAEEFALPELVLPNVYGLSPFAMMPQLRMPDYNMFPDWAMGPSMNSWPSQADAIWNSLMSSFDNMVAQSIVSVPEINVGDDCVVTVRLSPEANVNDTDIKVYAGERDIELHITSVKIREWRADPADDMIVTTESSESSNSTDKAGKLTETGSKVKSMLRGFGEMASSTTIRRIPAPAHCDVFSEEAKATLDTHTNSLLIKFPVKAGGLAESTGPANNNAVVGEKEWQQQSHQPADLAPLMDKSPEKKSWWSAMFAKDEKKTVPIVKREEF